MAVSQSANTTVCLADYCPILGCQAKNVEPVNNRRFDDNREFSRSTSRRSFGNLEKCTSEEVEALRVECLATSAT